MHQLIPFLRTFGFKRSFFCCNWISANAHLWSWFRCFRTSNSLLLVVHCIHWIELLCLRQGIVYTFINSFRVVWLIILLLWRPQVRLVLCSYVFIWTNGIIINILFVLHGWKDQLSVERPLYFGLVLLWLVWDFYFLLWLSKWCILQVIRVFKRRW